MPTLDLDDNKAMYQIRAYAPGAITINDTVYHNSLIISPQKLIENWAPQTIGDLTAESFSAVIELKPAILLIGTGSEHVFLATDIYGHLINLGIGVEVMSTGAACRTYNALSAEDRNVVAALVIK
jgi:uncharacterized protein